MRYPLVCLAENAFEESFNSKVRAGCFDRNWFQSLDDARSKCDTYRIEINEDRLYRAIGNKTPMELLKSVGQPSRPAA